MNGSPAASPAAPSTLARDGHPARRSPPDRDLCRDAGGSVRRLVPRLEAPILALQGGADQSIPHEDNVEFEQALRDAGKEYELIEFEGAPHSFFDRKQEEFAEASEDAWNRVLAFIA